LTCPLPPVQRRVFIFAGNKIALNAGWSDELLAEELPALRELGFDPGITGFSDGRLADYVTLPRRQPRPRRDRWRIGWIDRECTTHLPELWPS
jgi:hypothetical protein